MNDTPLHIAQIQHEIHVSKPLVQRVRMALDLTELSRNIILNQLKQKNPVLTKEELKIELFKICYRDNFDVKNMTAIVTAMKQYLQEL